MLLVAATALLLVAGALWPTWRAVAWWLLPLLWPGRGPARARLRQRALDERREWRTKIDEAGLSAGAMDPRRVGRDVARLARRGWDRSIPPIRWPG